MKEQKSRRRILLGLCVCVAIFILIGCKGRADFSFAPYEMEITKDAAHLEKDPEITLDGYLDEEIWTEAVANEIVVTSDVSEDVYMKSRCYITKKGVYFGVIVYDFSIYYNANRKASRNTSVEIYFKGLKAKNAYSLRLVPTGEEGGIATESVEYVWKSSLGEWVNWKFKWEGAANIQGTMNTSDCVGYTAEAFVPWEAIGDEPSDYISYMPAFNHVETSSESDSSRVWSGYAGKASKTSTYVIVSNTGIYDYTEAMDSFIVLDDGMSVDGVLNESAWTGGQDMKYGYTTKSGAEVSLVGKYYATEKGAYFGFVVEDPYLYYSDSDVRAIGLNTGLELYFAQVGATELDANALELRITATNVTARYRAINTEGDPWVKDYFPLLSGTTIQGSLNSSDVSKNTGYTVELFIPWEAFGLSGKQEGVLLYPVLIHSEDMENSAKKAPMWQYCRFCPLSVSVAHDPSENYLEFTDNGVLYRDLNVPSVIVSEKYLEGEYYYKTVSFTAALSQLTEKATCEKKNVIPSLHFSNGITYRVNADQTVTLKIPKAAAQSLKKGSTYKATYNGISIEGIITYTTFDEASPDVCVSFGNGVIKNSGNRTSVTAGAYVLDSKKNSTAFVPTDAVNYVTGLNGDKNGAISTNHYKGPYTVLNDVDLLKNQFTISTWFYVPKGQTLSTGNSSYILGTSKVDDTTDGFRVTIREEDGAFVLAASTAGNTQTKARISGFGYGEWHNLTVVREKAVIKYYMDGELVIAETIPANFSFGTNALSFGAYIGETWAYRDAKIVYDEIRMYYTAVDEALIQDIIADSRQ